MPIIRGVICDNCGVMMYWCGNVSKQRVAAHARNDGWTIGKRCLCGDCQPRRKAEKRGEGNE